MCTSISFSSPHNLAGRTMDIEYSFGEQVVITPRNYTFSFRKTQSLPSHYAMIGMANADENVPLYAEATNEKGLYMAGLNFPDNAFYFSPAERQYNKIALAPYEIIPYVLGSCKTVLEAQTLLDNIQLMKIPFSENHPLSPLHWHIADATGSIVAEPMENGLNIYHNPIGVLTNNPPFPYHIKNLDNYQSLTPYPPKNQFCASLPLKPYGQGMGALGLPGDFSPMSRFVKASFLKLNSVSGRTSLEDISQFFHVLDSVSMVLGSVITESGKYAYSLYSCCMDTAKGIYYYKTYDSHQITAIHFFHEQLDSDKLKLFPLISTPQIHYMN